MITDAQMKEALKNPAAILRELDRIDGEESLRLFIKRMWHVLEPSQPFKDSWVLGAICEHLTAVTEGQITRLLMNVSPGSTKSLTTDVFWPAWEWGPKRLPHMRYVCASYSHNLTIRDNMRFQRLVESQSFQDCWADRFKKDERQWEKIKCANDKTGWKIATSVGGVGTGERGNRFIIDDPNSVQEAESDTIRNSTNMWFREVVPDRLNDMTKDAIIVIQQRTHGEDVSAVAIELGYEHLMIPMEYDETRRCVTVLGWEDPRRLHGDLAWPERFPMDVVDALKRAKGEYAWAAQYDQMPVPRGGGILKSEWFKAFPPEGEEFDDAGKPVKPLRYPAMEYVILVADTAFKEKERNDYSACAVLGLYRERGMPRVLIMEGWKGRYGFNDLMTRLLATARKRQVDAICIEDKASGQSVIQELRRLCRDGEWSVIALQTEGDKEARTHSVVPVFSAGLIWAPDRAWAQEIIDEMTTFPFAPHNDMHDAVVHGVRYLRKLGLLKLVDEQRREDYDRFVLPDGGFDQPSHPYADIIAP